MTTGYMDFRGVGIVAVKMDNGEERVVSTTMIAHGVKYRSWYEDHFGNGCSEQFAEAEEIDETFDITFPFPDEFIYVDIDEEGTSGATIEALIELVDVEWDEITETFT